MPGQEGWWSAHTCEILTFTFKRSILHHIFSIVFPIQGSYLFLKTAIYLSSISRPIIPSINPYLPFYPSPIMYASSISLSISHLSVCLSFRSFTLSSEPASSSCTGHLLWRMKHSGVGTAYFESVLPVLVSPFSLDSFQHYLLNVDSWKKKHTC